MDINQTPSEEFHTEGHDFGTPEPPRSTRPVSFPVEVYGDPDIEPTIFEDVVELVLAETGLLIIRGISPLDNETITALGAFAPGGWTSWRMVDSIADAREEQRTTFE